VSTTAQSLDLSARYRVDGWPHGVAFYLIGYAQEWEPSTALFVDDETGEEWEEETEEGEWVDNVTHVRAVMVGDDYEHIVDVDDLTPLGENDYCGGCGQIGCDWH
jgi:hypothetical protein